MLASNLIQSVELLAAVSRNFAEKCVAGIEADVERCESMVEKSLAMVTSLAPRIGYDPAAAATLWQKMGTISKSSTPQFFSTHPAPENRQQKLTKLATKMAPYYEPDADHPVYVLN